MPLKSLVLSMLVSTLALYSPASAGQMFQPRTYSLTAIDRDFMEEQRESIDALARTHLGRQVRGDKENDLTVLQQLLDQKLVKPDQVLLLQAMGIVMGDLLSEELKMPWIIYEDKLGRSRALRLGLSDHYLFPVTMISRRAEVGAAVDVRAVYAKAVAAIEPHLPPRPFQ
jgi:hypothetical protein